MTFELIQQTLGEGVANEITEAVLSAANASQRASDPSQHERALRELLTALLAVLVTRNNTICGNQLAAEQSQRLLDLISTMGSIERQNPAPAIIVH